MRIEVDPEALIAAGQQTGAIGSQLARLSDALGAALGGGISSGMDPAGLNFGLKYGHQAGEFTSAVADAANAFNSVGMLLQATGYNYRNADAAATIGGPGPSGGVGAEPGKALPAHVPAGPNGVTVPPPEKWYLIQPFLQVLPGIGFFAGAAMTWPSGNAPIMGVTAGQWRNFATGFALIEPQLTGIKNAVAAQQVPETGAMKTALESLGTAISSLAEVSNSVAQSITDFANGVQETQDAIRRILDRLSLDGLWDTVKGIFTGEADDILREVAHDVGTVLHNFQSQVKGIVGLLDELTGLIGDAATAFQKWIRPILVETFGDRVGNDLANAVTLYTDIQVGAVTGLIGTVSGIVAMADPDTWKGMAEMALSVAKDPSTLPDVLINMGKEFVAWDKWSGDHPGRAAGEAAFNIGSLFVPGGALSKTGSVAKGLNLSRRVLEEGRLPKVGELGSWTRGTPSRIETPHVPEFNPSGTGGVPPLRPEGIPGGAGPGTPGAGPAPGGSTPSGGAPSGSGPSGGGPRTGEPSAPSGRPSGSGAEGGAGPRAPVDGGRGGGGNASPGSAAPSPNGSSPGGSTPSAAPGGVPESGGGSTAPHGPSGGAPEAPTEAPAHSAPSHTPSPESSGGGGGAESGSHGGGSAVRDDAHLGEQAPDGNEGALQSAADGHESGAGHGAHINESESSSSDQAQHDSSLHHHSDDSQGQPDHSPTAGDDHNGGHDGNHHGETRPASEVFPDAKPYGDLSEDQFNDQFTDDRGQLIYPDDTDPAKPYAIPGTVRVLGFDEMKSELDGLVLDRLGHPGGGWLSPEGTTYEERALPPTSLEKDYFRYEVNTSVPLPDGWSIEASRVAPWFGQPGGGIQYRLLAPEGDRPSVQRLIDIGFLEWL
ncbi:glycohydrolase toxin TNT-related protein [Mycolicibacterium obuense]|uniref:glycohydrolase toxin TNT-related protein n=1 Tax=Mycolicibacterium obuense TaxID=1807 RepID=UPI0023F90632|nr:glycohydrolase toxin TNT-related protein [Mycolicibacterium obuense]